MAKSKRKRVPKRVLKLPDLEQSKSAVLNSLTSASSKRSYDHAIRWVIADLTGKGGHIRTIPVPDWVKTAVDAWILSAGISSGPLLRSINKAGRIWGNGFTPKVIWAVVKRDAKTCGLPSVAPHDLRRTCARLCHQAGGELEQIHFLLGHVSVQTTERYLGCKHVNDHIGLEPDAPS
jgi:integrase